MRKVLSMLLVAVLVITSAVTLSSCNTVNDETHNKCFTTEELFKEVISYPSRTIYRRIVYDN